MRTDWPAKHPSPKKSPAPNNRNHRFLALFGDDSQLDLAFVDIEDGLSRVALLEDRVILRVVGQRPAFAGSGQEDFRIERPV